MSRLFVVLLSLLLLTTPAWAAVTKTGAAGSAGNSDGAEPGLTYTMAADGDALVCGVSLFEQNGGVGTVSGVTYNSVTMTQVVTATDSFSGGPPPPYTRAYLFRLTTADGLVTGAHAVAVTFSGASGVVVGCQGFKGVDQTTPVSNSASANSGTGTSTPASVTVTSAAGEHTIDTVAAAAALSSATELWSLGAATLYGFDFGGGSDATGAASVQFQWTVGSGDIWSHVSLSLKAAAAASTQPPRTMHQFRQR